MTAHPTPHRLTQQSAAGKGRGSLIIVGLILLAIAGWAGFRIFMMFNPPGGGASRFQMPPAAVRVAAVRIQPMVRTYDTTGTVTSDTTVTLSSQSNGQVKAVLVKEGDNVGAGQTLIQLDGEEEQASLRAANAIWQAERQNIAVQSQEIQQAKAQLDAVNSRLKQVQSEYDRFAALQKDNVISPLEFEAKKAVLESQQAEMRGAREKLNAAFARLNVQRAQVTTAEANEQLAASRLQKSSIKAPFSGVIGQKRVNVGAYVQRGEPLITLTSMQALNIRLSVPERYLPWLSQGHLAYVHDTTGKQLATRITFIDPLVDVSLRSVALKLALPTGQAPQPYRPGQFLDVNLVLQTHQEALTIPEEAVLSEAGQSFAFVVLKKSDKVTIIKQGITLGFRKPGWVEVTKGLHREDFVVVGGLQKVQDKAEVKIIP